MTDAPRDVQPHRGTLILVFGILSFVVCMLFGVAAWVMGNADLAAMERGEMDRSGEGMTKTGKILGIISVILAGLALIVGIVVAVVVAAAATHAR